MNFNRLNSAAGTNIGGGLQADSNQNSTTFIVVDNDGPSVVVSKDALSLDEGQTDTYTVKLKSNPPRDVTVTVSGGEGVQVNAAGAPPASSATLNFTPSNGTEAQTVTVTAAEDAADDPGKSVSVTNVAAWDHANYGGRNIVNVVVNVTDNDATTVELAAPAGDLFEGKSKAVTLTLGRGLVEGEKLTIPLTFGGSATRGADYTLVGKAADGVAYSNLEVAVRVWCLRVRKPVLLQQ